MSSRGYLQHNMLFATQSQYSWGGTDYTKLSIKSGTTIPTGLTTNVRTTTTHNTGSVTDATTVQTFIIPSQFDAVTIIDGIIEGTLKIGAICGDANPGDWIEVTKAEITLRAIDTTGSARTIAAIQEVWSGSIKVFDGGALETVQLMYWLDVDDIVLESDERIVVDVTLTYTVDDQLGIDEFFAYVYCTKDTDETTITLPFVM